MKLTRILKLTIFFLRHLHIPHMSNKYSISFITKRFKLVSMIKKFSVSLQPIVSNYDYNPGRGRLSVVAMATGKLPRGYYSYEEYLLSI